MNIHGNDFDGHCVKQTTTVLNKFNDQFVPGPTEAGCTCSCQWMPSRGSSAQCQNCSDSCTLQSYVCLSCRVREIIHTEPRSANHASRKGSTEPTVYSEGKKKLVEDCSRVGEHPWLVCGTYTGSSAPPSRCPWGYSDLQSQFQCIHILQGSRRLNYSGSPILERHSTTVLRFTYKTIQLRLLAI